MHYKAPDNSLHFIESEFAHLLPAGCVPITDEEAESLRPKQPEPTYQQLRAPEYPPLSEFADAFYWMQKGDSTKMDAYMAKCEEVKTRILKE